MLYLSLWRVGAIMASLAGISQAGYHVSDDYTPANFFDKFQFFDSPDPTHGFVKYVDKHTAQNTGLIAANSDSVYIAVDHTTVSSNGRPSVRIGSNATYTHGVFVADIAHMPYGCGLWPALWTVGPNWPSGGEIDIIEQVNLATNNQMTLHTSNGCNINGGSQTGQQLSSNCYAYANGNQGCGVTAPTTQSYGAGFNANGGGVYAMEWTSERIAIWFFPRNDIPTNVLSSNPDPSTWGLPTADFRPSCNLDAVMYDHAITIDTTMCGDWASAVWGGSPCASKAASCSEYVANNPGDFTEAYWVIHGIRVFQG